MIINRYFRYFFCYRRFAIDSTTRDTKKLLNATIPLENDNDNEIAQRRARRARLLDIWQHRNDFCEANFDNSEAIFMLDKEPLVKDSKPFSSGSLDSYANGSTDLVVTNCRELRYKLQEYGLLMNIRNSALLDFVDGHSPNRPDIPLFGCALSTMRPPSDLKISLTDLKAEVARSLGGRFISQRQAIYTLRNHYQRELLTKFQGITYFYHVHRFCPTCASLLQMRSSKAFAKCLPCNRRYYPTISPLVTCLVRDPTDEYCALTRTRGSLPNVFSTIIGVPEAGESFESTVLREVARSIGLHCFNVQAVNLSQTWPPEAKSTITTAFIATSSMAEKLDPFFDDIAYTAWFTREEVLKALRNTQKNAEYLDHVELEYDTTRAAKDDNRNYETVMRKPHPKVFDRMTETVETFDNYESMFSPSDDYTLIIEEPLKAESVRESYRRHREEDYSKDRYDIEEYDEDEAEAKLPDYHVDKLYKRERERIKKEKEARTGFKIIDEQELREEAEKKERRKRRKKKRLLMSDFVFQIPPPTTVASTEGIAFNQQNQLQFVPPVGTIANTLIQAWVDCKL